MYLEQAVIVFVFPPWIKAGNLEAVFEAGSVLLAYGGFQLLLLFDVSSSVPIIDYCDY